jgi:hypothetical protein
MRQFPFKFVLLAGLMGLVAAAAALAGGTDAPDMAVSEPAATAPSAASPESVRESVRESEEAAEDCACNARSPGGLSETQRLMQEWQEKAAP